MEIYQEVLEEVKELHPDSLKADGFDKAIIGYTTQGLIVYEVDKMIEILVTRDGISHLDALEYLDFNVFGAYLGDKTPIYMRKPE